MPTSIDTGLMATGETLLALPVIVGAVLAFSLQLPIFLLMKKHTIH